MTSLRFSDREDVSLSRWLALLLVGWCLVTPAGAANFTSVADTAVKFGVHEIALKGDDAVRNPFDTLATVTFTPPSGAPQAKTVHAFYDGDGPWRARVYVSEPGEWKWSSQCATDKALHGVPADTALGLEESAGYSPAVQDMAALLASKMPLKEASAVLAHRKRQLDRLLTSATRFRPSRRCRSGLATNFMPQAALRWVRCRLAQASGVQSLTCQLVIVGRAVSTSRR
jgi:hypothetical protein